MNKPLKVFAVLAAVLAVAAFFSSCSSDGLDCCTPPPSQGKVVVLETGKEVLANQILFSATVQNQGGETVSGSLIFDVKYKETGKTSTTKFSMTLEPQQTYTKKFSDPESKDVNPENVELNVYFEENK